MLKGLREFIDSLDKRLKTKARYYIDRKTGEKVYYPELPYNYKSNFMAKFRSGDRMKTALRKKKHKIVKDSKPDWESIFKWMESK